MGEVTRAVVAIEPRFGSVIVLILALGTRGEGGLLGPPLSKRLAREGDD